MKHEFLIRIVYKSGNTQEFWVKSFTYEHGSYKWHNADEVHHPIDLGGSEIAAVWQVGAREV